jgi:Protein of unknown function (DUF3180)
VSPRSRPNPSSRGSDPRRGDEVPQGTILPTSFRQLALTLVVGAVLGYAFAVISEKMSSTSSAPRVQWTAVVVLAALAVADLVMAWWTYRTVHRERRRMEPGLAVMFLLFGKASSVVGAFVAGGYAGFALHFVGQLDVDLPRERVIRAIVAAVTGVAVVISGLLLERACRIPKDPDA